MPGLVPGIHVFSLTTVNTWMAGTSPAMTTVGLCAPYFSPTLNGGSLPGGVVSSAIASIIATMT